MALSMASAAVGAQQPPPQYVERVEVARLIVDARALDDHGDPITGLTADDFKVTVDGMPARVETATWVGGRAESSDVAPPPAATPDASGPVSRGRLIVLLFQKDVDVSRLRGLMNMLLKSREVLDSLTPGDRVAILSFDKQLAIWTDFTSNRNRLDRILSHDLLMLGPPPVSASPAPSLVAGLDPERARHTYEIEQALELIGDALVPLPGSKSLVLFGYGFGQLTLGGGVAMENNYDAARQALVDARTSVFSLDITDADYHSLEAGLQIVSEQTGGFYAKTHLFPGNAMRQLAGALAGYYALFVEKPDSHRAVHDIKTELTRRKGRVLALTSVAERSQ